MQISQKSKETIDACRFCWMCRHICPVGNATGQERNTARARALSLSLVVRDGVDYTADIIDNVYECALCGACTADCATGWDPVKFTKEARLAAALEGKMPEYVEKLLENFEESGNIYAEKISKELAEKIASLPKSADTLLFLGADARYKSPENAIKAIELLEKAGVEFTVLENEPDSGYALDFLFGASDETKKAMQDTAKTLDFKTVVCYSPDDAKVFLREYKEWGIDISFAPVTFTAFVSELIKDGKLKVKKQSVVLTPQDAPALSRDLEENDKVREILSACGEVLEMLLNKKDTVLAGNLIMNEYMPDVMALVAKNRWTNAKNVDAKVLVTESPAEYEMLKAYKPDDIELKTIEEVVLQCL